MKYGCDREATDFVEIDEARVVRLQGRSTEAVLDVDEPVVDGSRLKLRTADGGTTSVDSRQLARRQ